MRIVRNHARAEERGRRRAKGLLQSDLPDALKPLTKNDKEDPARAIKSYLEAAGELNIERKSEENENYPSIADGKKSASTICQYD